MARIRRSMIVAAFTAAALGQAASARPLHAYEAFDYNPAPFPLPGCNGPSGWGGPWTAGPFASLGGSLTNPQALPSSGRRCVGSGPMEAFRPLAASLAPTAASDLWISALMRTPAGGAATDLVLEDLGTMIALHRVPTTPFLIQANGPMLAGGTAGAWGQTDLVVIRLRLMGANTEVSLYHNPPDSNAPPAVVLPIVPGVLSVARVYLRIDSVQEIDEIRIGDSFAAVAAGSGPCYPDCNHDGVLTVADFGCFQTSFAIGQPYADCNGDGALTVADFGCFQTRFAIGCP